MLKVIIIDDESMTRRGLIDFVPWEEHGFEVYGEAADGEEGLELARQVHPDLAICDIRMPKMDGITFAKHLKVIAPECRLIFLSGYSDKEYLKSAIKLNAVDYLEKPVNMQELNTLLLRVRDELESEISRLNRKNKLQSKMDLSHQYLLNTMIKRIIDNHEFNQEQFKELLDHMNIAFPCGRLYRVVVIENRTNPEYVKIVRYLKDLREREKIGMLIAEKDEDLVIVHTDEISTLRLKKIYDAMFEALRDSKNPAIYEAGIGRYVESLEDLEESYHDAKEAIDWFGYKYPNELVFYDGTGTTNSAIRDTERYITENYDQKITIQDIADEVYLTPQYLCKVFKDETGTTINNYITDMRMKKAKELLMDRNLKLYEVAAMVGYHDPNYFTRVFKRYFKMSPSEYREQNKV